MSGLSGFTTGMRSEVRADGTLQLSLVSTALPAPGDGDVVVEIHAAPLHPADIGLLLGPADLSRAEARGEGQNRSVTFQIPSERIASLSARMGKSLPVGNEGAGIVVAAGDRNKDLIGTRVAVMGGGMLTQYRVLAASDILPIADNLPIQAGAAVLINPLTALTMLETMRAERHTALVHTAAASSLGQMLNRICLRDGVGLVNVVRSPDQFALLKSQGAKHVCDSSAPTFIDDLTRQVGATHATLAFDAVGGGKLASQILAAMEHDSLTRVSDYNRYGSKVHKQVYFYGGLDSRPSELDRTYGMSWSVGGWLIFDELQCMAPDRRESLRARITDEMATTFTSDFAGELSMSELMRPENLKLIAARRTGLKFLVNPAKALGA